MKTITKLVNPQPHGAISECVSGEFAVVGFDIHQNVIDANITFHGKYIGDTVKMGERYYVIHAARVVAIKDEWWWVLDVEEDAYGAERLQFEKAWYWLGQNVKECAAPYYHELNDRSESTKHTMYDTLQSVVQQLPNHDSKAALTTIALLIAILYCREETAE